MRWRLTKPSTATAFPLRLRLHYKAARVGGVSSLIYIGVQILSGQSKGTVYAHAYFSASVERTLQADNFGDIFAGLTSVAL